MWLPEFITIPMDNTAEPSASRNTMAKISRRARGGWAHNMVPKRPKRCFRIWWTNNQKNSKRMWIRFTSQLTTYSKKRRPHRIRYRQASMPIQYISYKKTLWRSHIQSRIQIIWNKLASSNCWEIMMTHATAVFNARRSTSSLIAWAKSKATENTPIRISQSTTSTSSSKGISPSDSKVHSKDNET